MKTSAKIIKSLIIIIAVIIAISCNNDDEDEIIPESGTATLDSPQFFDYEIYDFSIVDDTCGWAIGDKDWAIFKYSEAGAWKLQHEIKNGWHFSSVCAASHKVAFLGTQSASFDDPFTNERVYSQGSIFRTKDAGVTWERVYTGMSIGRIFFVNENVGYAITRFADSPNITRSVVMTKDGGDTWSSSVVTDGLMDVKFINEQKGFIVGSSDSHGFAYITDNGGFSWTSIVLPRWQIGSITEIEIVNESVIYLIGGMMFRTEDGGATWEERCLFTDNRNSHSSTFARFINANEGFSFGKGTLDGVDATFAYTKDGGTTWVGCNNNIDTELGTLTTETISNAYFHSNGEYVQALYHRTKPSVGTIESIICDIYLEGN